jgi:predicted aconitase with swiveling domain
LRAVGDPRPGGARRIVMAGLMQGQVVVAGSGDGELLVSMEPLSFWGGYDSRTGEIIDRRHPLSGSIAKGRVLALPSTIGSSTTTAVLLEAVRAGTAPAAILTIGVDSFLALASIVAHEMYGCAIPLVALEEKQFRRLRTGTGASVRADGMVRVLE